MDRQKSKVLLYNVTCFVSYLFLQIFNFQFNRYSPMDIHNYQLPDPTWEWVGAL